MAERDAIVIPPFISINKLFLDVQKSVVYVNFATKGDQILVSNI